MNGIRDSTMTAEMPTCDGEGYSPPSPEFPAGLPAGDGESPEFLAGQPAGDKEGYSPPSPEFPEGLPAGDGESPEFLAGQPAGDKEGYSPPSPEFPARLRVLLVDDDPVCLKLVAKKLRSCLYEVTICLGAEMALSTLRERKGEFDLVMSDVHMSNIDGLQLLEHIKLEMDLPVIMMSGDEKNEVIMKGVNHGACDYILKPVKLDYIKTIWQHVLRKKGNELKKSGSIEESKKQNRPLDEVENALSADQGNLTNSRRKRDANEEEHEIEERDDSSTLKKQRVVWTPELHLQFNAAMNQLGIDKAVPKKILELMNVPGITRENVASHLQKYRIYLRQKEKRRNDPSLRDAGFRLSNSHDGFDLQAPAVSGQQGLMPMHAGPRRVTNTAATGMSAADQIGFYNPDAQNVNPSRIRSNNTQMPGLPQQAVQSYGYMGMQVPTAPSPRTCSSYPGANPYAITQMTPQGPCFPLSQQQNHGHLRGQLLDGLLSKIGQKIIPNENLGHVSRNQNCTSLAGNYANASSYGAVVPQAQFQNSCRTQSAGAGAGAGSHISTGATTTHTSTPMFQATGNIEALSNTTTSFRGVNSYDHFQDWRLHYNNPSYESAQFLGSRQNNFDSGSAISAHQDRNASGGCNSCPMISQRAEVEQNTASVPQHNVAVPVQNPVASVPQHNVAVPVQNPVASVPQHNVAVPVQNPVASVPQHNVAVPVQNPVGEKPESVPDPSSQDVLFTDNLALDDGYMRSILRSQYEEVDQYCNFDSLDDGMLVS